MRLSALLYFYGRRLRMRAVQELLVGLGIAIGVALVFAVQVANSSITNGSAQIVRSLIGPANLQLSARSDEGFGEGMVERVQALAGVERVAPVLDLPGSVASPRGHVAVQVAGAELTLAALDGLGTRIPLERLTPQVVMLPAATAKTLGISTTLGPGVAKRLPSVLLRVRGRAERVKVAAVLGEDTVGPLANAMAVIAPLQLIQKLAALPGRVMRILVQPAPGMAPQVREELRRLASGRLTVGPADEVIGLLEQATIPNTHATAFFAFVSALVGLLLAFNAMLLSAPERRRMIADLRIQGARPGALVQLMIFQALCLGLVASAAGVLAGELLAQGAFHQTPGYLATAFMLGNQTVVGWQPVVLSMLGGTLATCLAAMPPLLDLRRSRPIDGVHREAGEPGQALPRRVQIRLFAIAVLVAATTSGVLLLAPSQVVVATLGLTIAVLLSIPFCFTVLADVVQRIAARSGRANVVFVAARGCKASTLRSLALASTGAIAIFGAVVADGSHEDLLNGLYADYAGYVSTAQLWVTNHSDELATNSFPDRGLSARIGRIPGVAQTRSYQGGFLDWNGRRVWVIARSPLASAMLPAAQIVEGRIDATLARLHSGGWITVSKQLADAAGVRPGQRITLPTPSGAVTYRLAATTTNLGWASGAIVMNSADYRHAWGSADPSAIEVSIEHGASLHGVQQAIQATLAGDGLRVQTRAERAAQADGIAREGLSRLSQISLLLTIAAALSMAAAMSASIWQRRTSLASLRIQSFGVWQLRRLLLYESALILGIGCAIGALAGVYGHLLSDHFLRLTTGFPAPFSLGAGGLLETMLVVICAALVVLIGPGYAASQAAPTLALQE